MTSLKFKDGSTWVDYSLTIYPVGSVYLSYTNTSPATLFGGTWVQITEKVIRAANNVNTGGNDSVSHAHTLASGYAPIEFSWNTSNQIYDLATGPIINVSPAWTINTHANFNVSHSTYNGMVDRGIQLRGSSDSESVSNLPAYQNLYIWRRTA